MYTQIFDRFDASYGFDIYTGKNNDRLSNTASDWIKEQALGLWDMWVQQSVMFRAHDDSQAIFASRLEGAVRYHEACEALLSGVADADSQAVIHDWFSPRVLNKNFKPVLLQDLKGFSLDRWQDVALSHAYRVSAYDCVGQALNNEASLAKRTYKVDVPRRLLKSTSRTPSEAVDVLAAVGLESLETLNELRQLKCDILPSLIKHFKRCPDMQENMRMFHLLLGVVCNDIARTRILDRWPGWREMFEIKDTELIGSLNSVQTFVRGTHKASRYNRFCVAWAYNTNMLGHRVKLPKDPEYGKAADLVRARWAEVLAPQDINDKVRKLADLMEEVREILKQESDPNKQSSKTRAQPSAGFNAQLSPEAYPKYLSSLMGRDRDEDIMEATPVSNQDEEAKNSGYVQVNSNIQTVDEAKASNNRHTRVSCFTPARSRLETPQRLIDEAAGAAWSVKDPPPLEHGYTSGLLDEGSLHRFVGWGDHHIFDSSPELGAGELVIGLLVDCSGSMGGRPIIQAQQFIAAVMEGCKYKTNVKFVAMGFTGQNQCDLLHVRTPEEVGHLKADASTPTAAAIQAISKFMHVNHPSASKGLIVLTDGHPNSTVSDFNGPVDSDGNRQSLYNSKTNTRLAAEQAEFPVLGVGFGEAKQEDMVKIFGYGNVWQIKEPTDAVKIVCDVLSSVTM